MTKRDFYVAVMELEGCTDEMREVANKCIAQLDKKSTKPTKAQLENAGIKDDILDALDGYDEPQPAKAIAEAVGYTTAKVSALLRQLVAEGKVTKTEGKGKNPATYERA